MRAPLDGHAAWPAERPRAPVRALLADRSQLLAQALAAALPADPELDVVGVRADLAAAPIRRAGPDVLVLSYPLPRAQAWRLAEPRAEAPVLKILVLTGGLDDETVAAFVRAGAVGCVNSDEPPAALARAIRRAHAGEVLFPRGAGPAPPAVPGPSPRPAPGAPNADAAGAGGAAGRGGRPDHRRAGRAAGRWPPHGREPPAHRDAQAPGPLQDGGRPAGRPRGPDRATLEVAGRRR